MKYLQAFVGMTGFEPATTRPPDAYSNRAELHPESECKSSPFLINVKSFRLIFNSMTTLSHCLAIEIQTLEYLFFCCCLIDFYFTGIGQ